MVFKFGQSVGLHKRNSSCIIYYYKYRKAWVAMNGRLNKVEMESRVLKMKNGLYDKSWYPEWDKRQRGAANRILTNVLEVLEEYYM